MEERKVSKELIQPDSATGPNKGATFRIALTC